MTEELRPCPNPECQCADEGIEQHMANDQYWVACMWCGLNGPLADSHENAARLWNLIALPRPTPGARLVRVEDVEAMYRIQRWFERALEEGDAGDDFLNGDDGRDDGCDAWDDAHTLLSELYDILPRLANLRALPSRQDEGDLRGEVHRLRQAIGVIRDAAQGKTNADSNIRTIWWICDYATAALAKGGGE